MSKAVTSLGASFRCVQAFKGLETPKTAASFFVGKQLIFNEKHYRSCGFAAMVHAFLAHLSRRLIGELIVYPWSGVRRTSSVCPSSASSTMLKHLLLRNRLADQSQILCGASLGRGNDILFAASGSPKALKMVLVAPLLTLALKGSARR